MDANVLLAIVGALGMLLAYSALAGAIRPRPESYLTRDDEFRMHSLAGRPLLDRLVGPPAAQLARWLAARMGSAGADALALRQADFPRPFYTLGDFYGWKVISAFFLFMVGLCVTALIGVPLLLVGALGLGLVGLYLPDLSVRRTARRRQELFKLEMAFTLDRLAMFMASMPPERAIRLVAGRGGGLFVGELREVGYQMGTGRPIGEALETVLPRFPLPEYEEFISAIKLSTETGTRLSTVLGAMSRTMQSDLEHDLLAKGTSSVLPMVLGMGLALFGILVVLGAPAIWLYLSSGTL